MTEISSPYDPFAWFYQRYWAAPFHHWQMPILEHLLFSQIPAGARLVDFCCGVGELARHLVQAGYQVTGVDSSAEMLRFARENAPGAKFIQCDATDVRIEPAADAATCAFDSVNQLMSPGELDRFLASVYSTLKPGGIFTFDVNTEAAYGSNWDGSTTVVEPDHAFFLRGGFDREACIGNTQITMFRLLSGDWKRWDVAMRQRPWNAEEIEPALRKAGFREIGRYFPAEEGHFGQGRVYFTSTR